MDSKAAVTPDKRDFEQLIHSGPQKPSFLERHLTHLVTAGIGLVAAIVTLLAAMWGASIGAEAAVKAASMQNESEDVRRSQDRRDIAYKEYLNSANTYFIAWSAASSPTLAINDIPATLDKFRAARADYQSEINEVFVYGSDEAWSAHQGLARTLPKSLTGSELPNFYNNPPRSQEFNAAFNAFLNVRCREATALPRSSCSPISN